MNINLNEYTTITQEEFLQKLEAHKDYIESSGLDIKDGEYKIIYGGREHGNGSHLYLHEYDLYRLDFTGLDLSYVIFNQCIISRCIFDKCNVSHMRIFRSKLRLCKFVEVNGAIEIKDSDVHQCVFTDSNLSYALINNSRILTNRINNTILHHCIMEHTTFDTVDFSNSSFINADIFRNNFNRCKLENTDFRGVDLSSNSISLNTDSFGGKYDKEYISLLLKHLKDVCNSINKDTGYDYKEEIITLLSEEDIDININPEEPENSLNSFTDIDISLYLSIDAIRFGE